MRLSGGAMFWLFVIVFFCGDTYLFTKGYNTFFWAYKTPAELAKQKQLLGVE